LEYILKKVVLIGILNITMCILLSGCFSIKQPVYNVYEENIIGGKYLTQLQVEQAIVKAGVPFGWRMDKMKNGLIVATLALRAYTLIAEINYSASFYDIVYKDSVNMGYDGKNINKDYNDQIKNLYVAIQQNLLKY
jgi:hypothetical protein